MYTPHTVTLYNAITDTETLELTYNITLLSGVFLDIGKGSNIQKTGLADADSAKLYIPFDVDATDAITGEPKVYIEPKLFRKLPDKTGFWTLETGGTSSGVDCFFAKGEVVSDKGIRDLKKQYDYVFDVSTVDLRDFGSQRMQHWQVGGK